MSQHIDYVINILKNAPRIGRDEDEPEGTRYIIAVGGRSDTLAQILVNELEAAKCGS